MENFFCKFSLLFLILATLTFLSLPVAAAEGNYYLEIEEDEEEFRAVKGLGNSTFFIYHSKDDVNNKTRIKQLGNENTANINQQGENNFTRIQQYGDKNLTNIRQQGNNNFSQVFQRGNENDAVIKQDKNERWTDNGYGLRFGFIVQNGKENNAYIVQQGLINLAAIGQFGNENTAEIYQSNSFEAETKIQQNGNNNNARVMDLNEGIKKIDIVQNGDNRNLEIIISD